jgi:hypothetical protein
MTRGRALGGLAAVLVLLAGAAYFLLPEERGGDVVAPEALAAPAAGQERASGTSLPVVPSAGVARSAPRLPRASELVATSVTLCLSSFVSRNKSAR